MTAGIPGTGLFWTEQIPPGPVVRGGHRLALLVVVALVVVLVWALIASAP